MRAMQTALESVSVGEANSGDTMRGIIEGFRKELHHAIRRIARSPGFCIVVLLIAIGIGTATTIFALLDALLLRPLPAKDPGNLVQVVQLFPNLRAQGYFPLEMYRRLTGGSSTLFDVAGQSEVAVALDNGAGPDRTYVQAVTDNFFVALGIKAAVGTVFGSNDGAVAVLSYDGWNRYYGRDPNTIGRFVRLGGHPFQIIGVTPQGFNGTNLDTSPAMRVPYRFIKQLAGPDEDFLEIIARLKPGIPREEAHKEATDVWKSLPEALPGARTNSRIELRSIENGASYFREQFRTALVVLMVGTGLVLLVVCANVGGLLLARSAARANETAVCLALGATRARIVAECILDSLLVMLLGGAAGAVLANGGVALLMRWMPQIPLNSFDLRPFSLNVGVGPRAIIFAIVACSLMAILSGSAPAWRTTRADLYAMLKGTMSEVRHRRLQTFLCSFQIALCLVLIISTGLMVRTLSNLNTLDPGFDKQHVATFSVDPRLVNYDSREIWLLQQRLLRETQSITGIEAAAISGMPLLRGIGTITGITLPGQGQQLTNVNFVTPEYFDLMKMRVVVGRLFQSTDKAGAKPEPVVVNEEFVRRFLQGRQAVGVRLGREGNREIVGVVNDSYYRSLRENPPPILYVSDFGPNAYPRPFVLYIRTRDAPETMIEPIRRVLQSVDPKVPIYEATTISAEIERSLWRERLVGKLAIWFGTFALLLSAIALYGALAYYITQRRREFGLRLALGASARHVIETVLRRISAVMIRGLAAGFGVYFITARWLKILFFGVRLSDPISIIVAVVLLIATAAAAAGLPIYRVLQLDPASVLKQE